MVGPGQEVEWIREGRKAEREELIELLDERLDELGERINNAETRRRELDVRARAQEAGIIREKLEDKDNNNGDKG